MFDQSALVSFYVLVDPRDGQFRYVGVAGDIEKRVDSHIHDSRRRKTPVALWIRGLVAEGLRPIAILIAQSNKADWIEVEKSVIANYRSFCPKLLNVAAGGNEPFCSTEVRRKNGPIAVKLRTRDERFRRLWWLKKNLCSSLRQGVVPEHVRAKLRELAAREPKKFGCFAKA